jgi:hypothetical protein
MSHEKSLNNGKKKKVALKSIKEKRAEKKAKHEEFFHERKQQTKVLT